MANKNYPDIPTRIKAVTIDTIVLVVFLLGASDVFSNQENPEILYKIITFISIFLLYDPVMVSLFGATIGHRFCKIEVQDESSGKKINFIKALIRFVTKAFLGWFSLLSIANSPKKQAIHDSIVNSVVVTFD
ncbi:RDD family protein [uncultured Tenacibaculum sp.]|uniref:RDD family protein n=1 Tax=uncultured Tenacibaculum sp. TaxID=174713 RepID=UPI0026116B72|nr:RDD family protein [uncultured Tenacibaculum sp.]